MPLGIAAVAAPAIPYATAAWGYTAACVCAYTPPETHQQLKGPSFLIVQSAEHNFRTAGCLTIPVMLNKEAGFPACACDGAVE
jgi:hypothetical protein